MSEFYEYDSSSARCLRSSPIAALFSLVIIFLGAAAFGLGIFYAKRNIITLVDADYLFPYLEYTAYAIVGVTGLFSLIAYLICVISSGWNAKRCFEGSKKATCGRCLNNTLLGFLVCAVVFWVLVLALLSYPVISMSLLLYRDSGPIRTISADLTYARHDGLVRSVRQTVPIDENESLSKRTRFEITPLQSAELSPSNSPIPLVINEPRLEATRDSELIKNPREIITEYFNCSAMTIDVSYYGFYDTKGYPLVISSMNIGLRIRDALICSCAAFLGSLFVMFGYLVLTICVTINYTRLQELRYYDPSVAGDETIRLRH